MTFEQIARQHAKFAREFPRIAGPDRALMARLDAITAAAKSEMGARYYELNGEW